MWVEDPDDVAPRVTKAAFDTQVTRAARRLPGLAVPERPSGVVGVYDVSDDWTLVYDRTDLDGSYVAIGTRFKNAPLVGELVRCLVEAIENGADHDRAPLLFTARRTGLMIDLSAYSRRRPRAANSVYPQRREMALRAVGSSAGQPSAPSHVDPRRRRGGLPGGGGPCQ